MEQLIKYYYNLFPLNVISLNDVFFFESNNKSYFLCKILQDIKYVRSQLKLNNYYNYFKVVESNFNSYFIEYNNCQYILFEVPDDYEECVDIFEIVNNPKKYVVDDSYRCNWDEAWIKKNDWIGYKIQKLVSSNEYVCSLFDYCNGLVELAILAFRKIDFTKIFFKACICHRRIFSPNIKLNYFNPLSFVIDYEVRDYAEYFKSELLNDDVSVEVLVKELESLIRVNNFSFEELKLFYIRLLFPSVFLDYIEKYLESLDNELIIYCEKKIKKYEKFLILAKRTLAL